MPNIQLAVNYSPQAFKLFQAGEVSFDLFKCPYIPSLLPSLYENAKKVRPSYIHFDGWAGHGYVNETLLDEMAECLAQNQCRFINTHVGPPTNLADSANIFQSALDLLIQDYAKLCCRFGAEKILLENVPWETRNDFPFHRIAAEPKLICSALKQCGGFLLLDLAHARFTCAEIGLNLYEYIEQFPLHKLYELHVTGIDFDADGRRRDSMKMTEKDWLLFEWALNNISTGKWPKPKIIALEYGGIGPAFAWRTDIDALRHQLNNIARLLHEKGLR